MPGTEYRAAFCPVCFVSHGIVVDETVPGKRYIVLSRKNYWEKVQNSDPDKPLGVIQETGGVTGKGRNKFTKTVGYFGPDDDPHGFYPLIKNRLLQALKEWIAKGWIEPEEVRKVLEL
jgi:hypothetical protein